MLEHGVEYDQQLSEAGGESHLFRLPRSTEALVEVAKDRVVPDSHQRSHIQGSAQWVLAQPHTVRFPRRVPLSRLKGATPTRAATSLPLMLPNSGRRVITVAVTIGPIPGTPRSSLASSCHKGLERRKSPWSRSNSFNWARSHLTLTSIR